MTNYDGPAEGGQLPDGASMGPTEVTPGQVEPDPLPDVAMYIDTAWARKRNDNTKWHPLIEYLSRKYGLPPAYFGAKLITQDKQRGNRILKELPRETGELRYAFISCDEGVNIERVIRDLGRAALPKMIRAVVFLRTTPVAVIEVRDSGAASDDSGQIMNIETPGGGRMKSALAEEDVAQAEVLQPDA